MKSRKSHSLIPLCQPSFGREEEAEIIDTLRSGWVVKGPKTAAFEENFKKYVRSRYAVGVNSCTAGLHLSLIAGGIGKDDEVITTPMTFAATANVIAHQGSRPVFVDIQEDTLNIAPDRIEAAISDRTKAIIPVHFAGQPCEMEAILRIARKYNLFVFEDAAHALGSEYRGRKVGSIGDASCFSLYATKSITTGEGGVVTTNNKELADKIRLLSAHGLSKNAWERKKCDKFVLWDTVCPGFNYTMYDLQASIGLAQLKKIDEFLRIREKYFQIYDKAFHDIPEIVIPAKRNNIKHSHHLYVIIIKVEDLDIDRAEIIDNLLSEGIEAGVHFRALHLHSYYQKAYGFKRGDFPVAEYVSDRVISLPLSPKMTEGDIMRHRKKRHYGL